MAKTPIQIPTIPAFCLVSTPCKSGRLFLAGYKTLHEAWMSDSVELDHMLWALCEAKARKAITQRKFGWVCDELLTTLKDRLNLASLRVRYHGDQSPTLDSAKFHTTLTEVLELATQGYSYPVWGVLRVIATLTTAYPDDGPRTTKLFKRRQKMLDDEVLSHGRLLIRRRFPGMFKEYW